MKDRRFDIRESLRVGRPVDEDSKLDKPLPKGLKHFMIFATFCALGNVAAYFIDPTGLLCGVLAVAICTKLDY